MRPVTLLALPVGPHPPGIHGAREGSRQPPAVNVSTDPVRKSGGHAPLREYVEVIAVIGVVTLLVERFLPLNYEVFGHIYLLTVILLCLRVGRWPVFFATIISAVAWPYMFIPPRRSFALMDFDDGVLLGTYFIVTLIAGQLTARIRAQERAERLRERHAAALYQLTRTLAGARTFDEGLKAALGQSDGLFHARTSLLLAGPDGRLVAHAGGSFELDGKELEVAGWVGRNRQEAGRFTGERGGAEGLHLPLLRMDRVLGVFSVRLPSGQKELAPLQWELLGGFADQLARLIEREQLRQASEREKFFAESDRLHRTLLDSVSHELKTPLAVLRSAGEKLDQADAGKRAGLAQEIRTATGRLDHLVANLLDQTRLESGGLKPALDWCDARDIINSARRTVGDALAGRPFGLEIPPDLPLFLADAPLMEQVMTNLLLNAAVHTPAGTPVQVTAGREPQGSGRIYLRVADRGPGIPVEMRGKLFEKFCRGRTARPGGLGLGLSIVRGFVLAQGGEVEAGENPGGGACITVFLPLTAHGSIPDDEQ